MRVYPINLLLEGKPCLVVGGGPVAARKVNGLLLAGARVTVVSPEACEIIADLAERGEIEWKRQQWHSDLVHGNTVVMVATDDDEANRRAAADARRAGIPVNVADRPDECDFVLPAVLRRGSITVAVGTGGASPALAAYLRKRLQETIGHEYAMTAEILGKLREILENSGVESGKRREIFKSLVNAGLAEKLSEKDYSGARKLLIEVVGNYADVSHLVEEPV